LRGVHSMAKYTFHNTVQLSENEYQTAIAGDELARLWKNGIITYNPEIQRGAKVKFDKENNEIEEAIYSKANVRKIYESIKSEQYYPDLITLNILKDGESIVSLDKKGNLEADGQINIADGQHRLRALSMLADVTEDDEKVDLSKLKFPVKITNFNTVQAQQQFYQFSQGLKISSSRAEYFNQKDFANIVVKKLIEEGKVLDGKVEVVKNIINKKETEHIVSFATLVNAIKMSYLIDDEQEAEELAVYLNEFFDELINVVPELNDYNKRLESKDTSLAGENFAFYGYVAVSKVLFEKEDWKKYVSLVNKLDLDKGAKMWYGMVIKGGKSQGYAIMNSSDSRKNFVSRITKEFKKLLENK